MNISYSQVSDFARCPLSWWFRYVVRLRLVERATHKHLLGTAFHHAVEYRNSDLYAPWREPYFREDVIEVGARYVEEHVTPDLLAEWESDWGEFDPRRSLGVMLEMVDLVSQDPASTEDRMVVVDVEHRVEVDEYTGIIDLVYQIGQDGPLVVRDWKTTSRLDATRAVLSPQPLWYAYLLGQGKIGYPLWVEIVVVSNVPASSPALTKPTKANPKGRLAATPSRYTPDIYTSWCEQNAIEPSAAEMARLRSPSHVAGFVQTARKLVTSQGLESVRQWVDHYGAQMAQQGTSRPEGCRDPRVCFGMGGGRKCDYAAVCLDLQDTGALKPAEEYGMEVKAR